MRPTVFVLLIFVLGFLSPVVALGRLVQPDGTVQALGTAPSDDGWTLLFPASAVGSRSWVTFPEGTVLAQVVLTTAAGRTVLDFPTVSAPGLRFAVEIPPRLLSMSLRGRLPDDPTLVRSGLRPDHPGEPWVTRSTGSVVVDLPPWSVAEGFTPLVTLNRPTAGAWKAVVTAGDRVKTFSFQAGVTDWDFAPDAWGLDPGRIEVFASDPRLAAVRVRAVPKEAQLPADPPTLLAWPANRWRDPRREWFGWAGTSVVVLVTADYRVQDAYLKRLAFFVEKKGFRGKLWTDADMAALHGWNAHDYSAPDLARFFTQAAGDGFDLNAEELELRERLTSAGVLVSGGAGTWEPGTGALVGISEASPPGLRAVLFTHEAFHGLYYTSDAFRSGVAAIWSRLSPGAQKAFRAYLAFSDYDPGFEALMVNEFQAYVLQRPASEWTSFFRDRVLGGARVFSKGPGGTAAQGWLAEYQSAAKALEALVKGLYGLRSGEVSLADVS